LQIDEPGAACIHFNQDCDNEYFNQLTSERRRTKYKYGHAIKVWEKDKSARNEVLDLKVYNLVAVRFLNPNWDGQRKYIDGLAAKLSGEKIKTDGGTKPPPTRNNATNPRRRSSGFVNKY
jgi:phage terminase large subunit GpA-like protein